MKAIYRFLIKTLVHVGLYNIDIHDVYGWTKHQHEALLILSLSKGSCYSKKEAAIALGAMKSKRALYPLSNMATYKSPELVITAIDAIEKIGIANPEILETLKIIKAENEKFLKEMHENTHLNSLGRIDKKMERLESAKKQIREGNKRFG